MLKIHSKVGSRGYGVILVKVQALGRTGCFEQTYPNAQLTPWNVLRGVGQAVGHWWQVRHLAC